MVKVHVTSLLHIMYLMSQIEKFMRPSFDVFVNFDPVYNPCALFKLFSLI
jgi:hypothetical protein